MSFPVTRLRRLRQNPILRKMVTETTVSRDDLQAHYDQHRDEYRVPEQVNVRHILIKSPAPGPDGKVDPKADADAKNDNIDM